MSTTDPFVDVAADFKRRLTDQEKRDFQICTLKDVEAEIERIQKRQDAKREMMNLRRLESFLEAVRQFGNVVEVFTNTSNVVAFIWGPMKFILQVASSWTYAFDRILEGYEKLGESFPMLRQYIDLFGQRPELKNVLRLLYKDILDFHKAALRFFTRPVWRQVFRSIWSDFNATFQYLLSNLVRHGRLLQDQVHTLQMVNTQANFQDVKSALAALQNEQAAAKRKVDDDEKRRHAEEKHSVETWIAGNFAATKDHHDDALAARVKSPNSGSWILQQKSVDDWMNEEFPKSSFLWMTGMPGAGKTVLASVIIEHCIRVLNAHTAYFYCKHDDPDTLTMAGILKAILMQQLRWRNDLVPYFAEQRQNSGEPILSSDRLTKALFAVVCKGSERQYLIIDGIDECLPEQRANILKCLNAAISECDVNEPGKLRILVVSQNETDIRRILGSATELCLSETQIYRSHQKDIDSYVEKRAEDIRNKFELSEAVCQDVNMYVTEIDDRMRLIALEAAGQFLYAKLVMENLFAQNCTKDFLEEIGSDHLPRGLAEAYERIIVRLRRNESRWKNARMLLGWMACALRPLKWHEIQGMKSIDLETGEVNFSLFSFRNDAVEICGSLIAIHGDRVRFMHSTATKFVAASTYIDLPLVECSLTALCIQYLSLECFECPPESDSKSLPDDHEHINYVQRGYFAFADYAVSSWMRHLINVCNKAQVLLEEARWPESKSRDILHELEEAAEAFVEEHLSDPSDENRRDLPMFLENTCARAAKRLFENILNNGENVQLLVRHVVRLQSTPDGCKKIGLPSLEKSFLRVRKTIESLASNNATSRENISKLQEFYGSKLFKCERPRCTFFHEGFTDSSTRNRHQRRHDRPYQCEVLGCTSNEFAFSNQADLKRHLEEFHPDAEIKARLFKIPEKVETKDHKFICTKCDKGFVRKNILKDHELAHAGQKPHECRICGKAFTRKNDCVRHEKIHENRIRR